MIKNSGARIIDVRSYDWLAVPSAGFRLAKRWLETYEDLREFMDQCENDFDLWDLAHNIASDAEESGYGKVNDVEIYFTLIGLSIEPYRQDHLDLFKERAG